VTDETTQLAPAGPSHPLAEAGSLGREMGRAYRREVEHHRKEMRLEEADAWARGPSGGDLARVDEAPPDQLDWWSLGRAAELDPARGRAAWERCLAEARAELGSGHRAAKAVDAAGTPWERAQFLAILEAFVADWRPRGGVEAALVEALAQAYSTQLAWTARLTVLGGAEARRQDREVEQGGYWVPPRVEAAAAVDQAAAMVDRFNRLFTRTLRALRDLRRYAPSVTVGHVDQLNLAQAQVNIAPAESTPERRVGAPLEAIAWEGANHAHEG